MATTTSSVNVRSAIRVLAAGTPDLGALTWDLGANGIYEKAFANGSGANQINKAFQDSAATTTSYDLDAGTLTDAIGTALTFARIAAVRVEAGSANAANITLGGDWILSKYITGWVDDAVVIPVHPGGIFEFVAPNATGVAVTATTGDVITVTVTGSDTYKIVILGS